MGHEEEVLLDSETAYKDSKNTKKKMGSTKNLFVVLTFVFVVGAISVGVGFSLYHCLAKQHIGGLGGEVEKTSDDQLVKVLDLLQLQDYLSTFEKNGLDYEGFIELNDNELKEMNIPIGPRKKIAKEIQELKKHPLSKKN